MYNVRLSLERGITMLNNVINKPSRKLLCNNFPMTPIMELLSDPRWINPKR
jgi:hypothetical protein